MRETPFWDRYFEVVDLLVGTENGYTRTYGLEPIATITT
ncbi:darcynin family protein [Nocardia sp. CA-107356]